MFFEARKNTGNTLIYRILRCLAVGYFMEHSRVFTEHI
jgi:hypothetical protein